MTGYVTNGSACSRRLPNMRLRRTRAGYFLMFEAIISAAGARCQRFRLSVARTGFI